MLNGIYGNPFIYTTSKRPPILIKFGTIPPVFLPMFIDVPPNILEKLRLRSVVDLIFVVIKELLFKSPEVFTVKGYAEPDDRDNPPVKV